MMLGLFQPLTHPTAEDFRKGGVHGFGTVVFTVSAQFGVPGKTHMGTDDQIYELRIQVEGLRSGRARAYPGRG